MIQLKDVPDEARETRTPKLRFLDTLLQREYPGYDFGWDVLVLDRDFDPAFLRYVVTREAPDGRPLRIRPVYCRTILLEILMENVAGWTEQLAEEHLDIILKKFPEGTSPLFD